MIRTKMVSLRLDISAIDRLNFLANKFGCSKAKIVKWALWLFNLFIDGESISENDLLAIKDIFSCKK